jgi:hypothetical protein
MHRIEKDETEMKPTKGNKKCHPDGKLRDTYEKVQIYKVGSEMRCNLIVKCLSKLIKSEGAYINRNSISIKEMENLPKKSQPCLSMMI